LTKSLFLKIYDFQPEGVLYRVTRKQTTPGMKAGHKDTQGKLGWIPPKPTFGLTWKDRV
jgi:hypothetical protein